VPKTSLIHSAVLTERWLVTARRIPDHCLYRAVHKRCAVKNRQLTARWNALLDVNRLRPRQRWFRCLRWRILNIVTYMQIDKYLPL